jgi:hypothetical protein
LWKYATAPASSGLTRRFWKKSTQGWSIGLSHLFLVTPLAMIAIAACPITVIVRRFSLRTMLIAMTLVAVVLRLGAWLGS